MVNIKAKMKVAKTENGHGFGTFAVTSCLYLESDIGGDKLLIKLFGAGTISS
jgi:hypothetical protein